MLAVEFFPLVDSSAPPRAGSCSRTVRSAQRITEDWIMKAPSRQVDTIDEPTNSMENRTSCTGHYRSSLLRLLGAPSRDGARAAPRARCQVDAHYFEDAWVDRDET